MKLIPLIILLPSLAVDVNAQKFRQEHFPFPPQFQTPNAGMFSSDSSLYLPPESHTTLPYFPIKNVNNLQFPYLPPTGTKAPSIYPSPFPFMISTTLVPNFDEDDDEENHGRIRFSTPHPPPQQKPNQTEKNPDPPRERKEMRAIPKPNFQPIQNRNDIKFPFKPPSPAPIYSSPAPTSTTPATRRMIVTTEIQRPEQSFQDQVRAASFQGPQFLPAGPGVYVSSTTEPAIPILRLSNEMDLDGSFSYEALGADQTHYVQHSRMENMGPDKQEQVVEGSYSYVGDNGQTYTVHYIADSNGFRASGDHLPVGPPVPEIIQRAVQYNLAEEAKKPPHLKSWQDDGRDNEISDSEKTPQYFQPPPPTRNLFTGRTPEAFSYSFSQGSNTGNNLVTAASTSTPIKTVDYTTEQSKPKANNGAISPQITFLASQGAHVPSMDTIQNTISRMFTTEKPALPQLVNYEAGVKEIDQDPNKGLWRWQYGINANNLSQNPNKDTISRSFGEGDDVMINFGDMTPEQYTNMIRSQFEYQPENAAVNQYSQNLHANENQNNYFSNHYQSQESNMANEYRSQSENNDFSVKKEDNQPPSTVTSPPQQPQPDNWYQNTQSVSNYNQDYQVQSTGKPMESRKLISNNPKILTHKDFIYPSPTITQSYDFEETFYEPRKLKSLNTEPTKSAPSNANEVSNIFDKSVTPDEIWTKSGIEIKEPTTSEPYVSSVSNLKFADFIIQESKSDFKPIITTTSTEAPRVETTTENIIEDILENNIFLKNLFSPEKNERHNENLFSPEKKERHNDNKITEEPKKVTHMKVEAEPKTDKIPKIIPYQPKPMAELKTFKKKPMDIAEIMNYVSMKNHFESGKVKPKSKQVNNNYDQRNELRFIPIQQEREENVVNIPDQKNTFRNWNQEQQEELRGMIKNYKVLQRNNNNNNHMKYDDSPLKRELSPPPLKSPSLPPLGRAGPSMKSYLPPIYV